MDQPSIPLNAVAQPNRHDLHHTNHFFIVIEYLHYALASHAALPGLLSAADREVELRPKSFEVLRYLVENAGRLVTKDELIKTVWPNVVVTDESLNRSASMGSRRCGTNDAQNPRCWAGVVQTPPLRVWTHVAPVTLLSPTPPTMAVLPSADSATEWPCLACPTASLPTSMLPCWVQTLPLRA
jgi:Transcriptional regulatory protein, C terminal